MAAVDLDAVMAAAKELDRRQGAVTKLEELVAGYEASERALLGSLKWRIDDIDRGTATIEDVIRVSGEIIERRAALGNVRRNLEAARSESAVAHGELQRIVKGSP